MFHLYLYSTHVHLKGWLRGGGAFFKFTMGGINSCPPCKYSIHIHLRVVDPIHAAH